MDKEKSKFKLPVGWIWTTIGEIGILSSGGTPSRGNSSYFNGDIPWVKSGELNYNIINDTEEKITKEALDFSNAKIIPANSLLIALYGSTVGRIATLGIDASTNQAVAAIETFPGLNQRFLYYYLLHNREKLLKKRKGGAQPNISQKILSEFRFPVPPLNEQNQIVYKIEELFSELDQAQKGLQKVMKQLMVYRHALLKSAYNGNLTKKWRSSEYSENDKHTSKNELPVSWRMSTLGYEGDLISGQHILKKDYNIKKEGMPYFTGPSDFGKKYPIVTKWAITPRVLIKKDDILITIKGSGLGKLNIAQEESTIGRQLMAYNFKSGSKLFIYYYLLFISKKLKALGIGSAIPGIDRGSILSINCPVPTSTEQIKIVEILELRFTLIENLEKAIYRSLNDIEVFKHSVLKKAFKGRLIKQTPSNDSANLLLQKIKIEKEAYLKAQKEAKKLISQKNRKMETKKTALEILKETENPISTHELWQNSIHEGDIESFYNEIKSIYSQLSEIKKETESFLSLKK